MNADSTIHHQPKTLKELLELYAYWHNELVTCEYGIYKGDKVKIGEQLEEIQKAIEEITESRKSNS